MLAEFSNLEVDEFYDTKAAQPEMKTRPNPFWGRHDNITTLSITTFSIMTLSIRCLYVTVRINDTQHNNALLLC
jgi:hypothetical protein